MFNRSGLDRFKKAQSVEPFSVNVNPVSKPTLQQQQQLRPFQSPLSQPQPQYQQHHGLPKPMAPEPTTTTATTPTVQATGVGGGQSTWQPPDWAVEPRPGVYRLEVVKDGEVLDQINLDKRRHIFGRQVATCEFVLDHPSVSRQHAAVVQHKNGRISTLYGRVCRPGYFVASHLRPFEPIEGVSSLFDGAIKFTKSHRYF